MPFIYGIVALITAAFTWADYTDHSFAPTNFLGPDSEPKLVPDPFSDHGYIQVPRIDYSDKLLYLGIFATILYTKPWK